MFKYPDCKVIVYRNNPESGRFEKQPSKIAFNKMPFELKVEKTQELKIISQGAKEIITGRIKDGKRTFFSGLIPIAPLWFMGNDYEFVRGVKKLSLVLFKFSEDNSTLVAYYFNHFYKENRDERLKLCLQYIQSLNA